MPRYRTHGGQADSTVIVDYEGNYFAIGPNEEIVPGTVVAGVFTASASHAKNPVGLPQRLQRELELVAKAVGWADFAHESDSDTFAVTKTGSTTTAIKIQRPVLPNDFTGGHYVSVLDYTNDRKRPDYLVASITSGDSLNLAAAMSEPAPGAKVQVIIRWKPKPLPNSSHFPAGSFGLMGPDGNWYVAEPSGNGGTIYSADLNGTTGRLDKVSAGDARTLIRYHGVQEGNSQIVVMNRLTGRWDFKSARIDSGQGGGGFAYGFVPGSAPAATRDYGFVDLPTLGSAHWGHV